VDLADAVGEVAFGHCALAACLLVTTPAKEPSAFDPHHPAQPTDAGLAPLVDQPCPRIDPEIQTQHRDQANKNLQPAALQFVLAAQARDFTPQRLHMVVIARIDRAAAGVHDRHGRDCNRPRLQKSNHGNRPRPRDRYETIEVCCTSGGHSTRVWEMM